MSEASLGWAALAWLDSLGLVVPDGVRAGERLELTPEQAGLIVEWYRVDADGEFVHWELFNCGPKGSAKSPEGALLCLIEAGGPCRFDGWDGSTPRAVPVRAPRVQITATAYKQSSNVFDWAASLADGLPGWSALVDEIRSPSGTIEMVEATVSNTGARASFVVADETWLWLPGTRLPRAWDSIVANAAKTPGSRVAQMTNPPELGRGSVAEVTLDGSDAATLRWVRRADLPEKIKETGVRDPDNKPLVVAALESAYGDAVGPGGWTTTDSIYDRGVLRSKSDAEAYRLWLGHPRAAQGLLLSPEMIEERRSAGSIPAGAAVAAGFDGSVSKDMTAIVIAEVDGDRVEVWEAWDPTETGPISHTDVDASMRRLARAHNLRIIAADAGAGWKHQAERWEADSVAGIVEEVWMTGHSRAVTQKVDRFESLTALGEWTHDFDEVATAHLTNMVLAEKQSRRRIDKRSEGLHDRNDIGVATVLAVVAASDARDMPVTVAVGGGGDVVPDWAR